MRSLFIACAALCISAQAHAATFDFSYHLPGFGDGYSIDASGTLTTTDTPVNGALTITGVTGTRTVILNFAPFSDTITGLLSPDTAYSSDDLLYVTAPYLDSAGFTFTMASNSGDDFNGDVNISYFNGAYHEPAEGFDGGTFTLSAVDVPEPASMSLLLGLTALAAGLRRRG